jgi:cobalt-zinc-cadmium efflux system protein
MGSVAQGQRVRPTAVADCRCGYPHLEEGSDDQKKIELLGVVLGLLAGFFVFELAVGFWSHSLSLLADAGHMLSDVGALGLTLTAAWLARKPASGRATFGYQRVEVLAALVNGISLVAIALFVTCEAIDRLRHPEPLLVVPMLVGAGFGLVINSLNLSLLHQHSHHDLNMRGALLHIVADIASSVGVILAALAVYCWNWVWLDAAAGLLVAAFTGLSAIPLIKSSVEVLMEYAPKGLEPTTVEAALTSFEGVEQVTKLYIWTLTSGQVMLCAHLTVSLPSVEERDRLSQDLQSYLYQEFAIREAVLQLSTASVANFQLHPLFNQSLMSLFAGQHGDPNLR